MSVLSLLTLMIGAVAVNAASLNVVNNCDEEIFLFNQNSQGSIKNKVTVDPCGEVDMGISPDWIGAINTGTGCNVDGTNCTTGGPTWDGKTPFSRAEFNFGAETGNVVYDISLIYGYNVGMEISTRDMSCDAFACTLPSGCPVPGPDNSCYSPCCASADACSDGALVHGGCVNNAGPGPHSSFYYNSCINAYAFPDNDGANGYTPKDFVVYTCSNTDVTLTLCPGTTSHYTS